MPMSRVHSEPTELRTALITGADGTIGLATALQMLKREVNLILLVRTEEAKNRLIAQVGRVSPHASVDVRVCDLGKLSDIRNCVSSITAQYGRLDWLVNNAGLMAPRNYSESGDHYEQQLAVNYIASFALTALLLPALLRSPDPKVVMVSSASAYLGRCYADFRNARNKYSPWQAYCNSKLAVVMLAAGLSRRYSPVGGLCFATSPGIVRSGLQRHILNRTLRSAVNWSIDLFGHDANGGAAPTLEACFANGIPGGSFIVPNGLLGLRGDPKIGSLPRPARSRQRCEILLKLSEESTGLHIPQM